MIYILAYLDKMYLQLANTNLTPISPFMTFPHPLPWPWRNVLTNLTFFWLYLIPSPAHGRTYWPISRDYKCTFIGDKRYPRILYPLLIAYNKIFVIPVLLYVPRKSENTNIWTKFNTEGLNLLVQFHIWRLTNIELMKWIDRYLDI